MDLVVDIFSLCGQYDRRELSRPAFIEACCRAISTAIGCSRAGIWLFDESCGQMFLYCIGIFDRNKNRMTMAPDETGDQVSPYFDALERIGHVIAPDAQAHPATHGFFAERLTANHVHSLMASSFTLNGRIFGAFTCTQVRETMNWSPAQLSKLKRIGARVSLALSEGSKTGLETYPAPL